MDTQKQGFHIAGFGVDGELEGVDRFAFEGLSDKWLKICGEYLAGHGTSFEAPWSGNLAHIRTKWTSSSGVALVSFSANGRPVVSMALASGAAPAAESSVLKMYVSSLRALDVVRASARSTEPFKQILDIKERPLMIALPFADLETSDQDNDLVRELSTHIAGAFFRQP